MDIKIPARLKKKLSAEVQTLIYHNQMSGLDNITTYFETTPLFFREYTNHGIRHINAVLEYADRLIPAKTFRKLNNTDISILVLGILLHDIGMFVEKTGLEKLLSSKTLVLINGKGKGVTWKELWDKHIRKLRHASEAELTNIYGKDIPQYDINDIHTCAEFIRKYHHEISYYIAVEGFPGKKTHYLLTGIKEEYVKLAGVLAKSHGMNLDDLREEIDGFEYANNMPYNVPIYYLMAILRMADYIDADEYRAPVILSDMHEFNSDFSYNEWRLNQLIQDRQWPDTNGSIDTLRIIAFPKDSKDYIGLSWWFKNWQQELDKVWVVIGEKYGEKYNLSIRRIVSNISENGKYNFITDPITIKVNPNIVKLLVAPLYSYNPTYGVRELLQNAIDACNERTAIDGTKGKIKIDIDTKKRIFKISDNGIGMDEEVIRDYYLNVGSSFCNSFYWTNSFVDDDKNPKINRNGRFGIGALAAFLIGEKIVVTTKHINAEKGYKFEYSIKPELLSVYKEDVATIGTTIEIVMNLDAVSYFLDTNNRNTFALNYRSWLGWYFYSSPIIEYYIDNKKLTNTISMEFRDGIDCDGWFASKITGFSNVHWSYSNEQSLRNSLFCNGMYICNGTNIFSVLREFIDCEFEFDFPSVFLEDKKGNLPVDILRSKVFDSFVFGEEIIKEWCKYYIAYRLVVGDKNIVINSKKGFVPVEKFFIQNLNCPIYFISPVNSFERYKKQLDNSGFVITGMNVRFWSLDDGFRSTDVIAENDSSKDVFDCIYENKLTYINMDLPRVIDNKWNQAFKEMGADFYENIETIIRYRAYNSKDYPKGIIYKCVKELIPYEINEGWLPYDETERRNMYKETYVKLEKYIKDIERRLKEPNGLKDLRKLFDKNYRHSSPYSNVPF